MATKVSTNRTTTITNADGTETVERVVEAVISEEI